MLKHRYAWGARNYATGLNLTAAGQQHMQRFGKNTVVLVASLALAGCGAGRDTAQAEKSDALKSGLWSISQTIFAVDAQGTGAEIAKKMQGRQLGDEICLSPEEAAKGVSASFEKIGWGNCQQQSLALNPDSEMIEGAFFCKASDGAASAIKALQGSASADTFDFNLERMTKSADNSQSVTMTISFSGAHKGDCAAAN